jgi:hypothetical protein
VFRPQFFNAQTTPVIPLLLQGQFTPPLSYSLQQAGLAVKKPGGIGGYLPKPMMESWPLHPGFLN